MANALNVGKVTIPYELRRSASARERRITVTPGQVEVLALSTDDEEAIQAFLARKRRWVFDTVREMERATSGRHEVPHFLTGSTIPYRGRKIKLTVRRTDGGQLRVRYRNGFLVDVPGWAADKPGLIASELKLWLKSAARRAAREAAKQITAKHGLRPKSLRVADFDRGWGSCGPEGNILINWQLIFAPPKVLTYVVAHEFAHLVVRAHSNEFWEALNEIMPAYGSAKSWLEAHSTKLSADFLA